MNSFVCNIQTKNKLSSIRKISVLINTFCVISGGCNAFGHSCFGGHGKRSEIAPSEGLSLESAPFPYVKLLNEANSINNDNNVCSNFRELHISDFFLINIELSFPLRIADSCKIMKLFSTMIQKFVSQ